MPRRYSDNSEYEPPAKKQSIGLINTVTDLKNGDVFNDNFGKSWKLGRAVGIGGFGEIYLASDVLSREVKTDAAYVTKVERHSNGPLFVEINCYLRIARENMIEEWKKEKKLKHLGIPHYVASGSHIINDEKYRFLIIPRFKRDLDAILKEKKIFNIKTVLTISYQIINVLEYIHSHGYIHGDIKASNIMLGKQTQSEKIEPKKKLKRSCNQTVLKYPGRKPVKRSLRTNLKPVVYSEDDDVESRNVPKTVVDSKDCDEIYLVDYGLASKYILSNGSHRKFCRDERKAHAGTVLFCSRDAHKGVTSRRSDLETLGYNIIFWLTGNLPWSDAVDEPEVVERRKNRCLQDISTFLNYCFNGDCPKFVLEYFTYIEKIQYEESPNYEQCRRLFKKAVTSYGYKDDSALDFDNLEGWGNKQKKIKHGKGRENKLVVKHKVLISMGPPRLPLHSNNISFKRPKLRKKKKNKLEHDSMMNWSKILVDPEDIIREARERKNTDGSDSGGGGAASILEMDLISMNPTPAMMEVFSKCKERTDLSPKYKGECAVDNIEGYTPAMMNVYVKMKEQEELELGRIRQATSTKKTKTAKKVSIQQRCSTRIKKNQEIQEKQSLKISKSQQAVSNKKEVALKKSRSVSARRVYSLRG